MISYERSYKICQEIENNPILIWIFNTIQKALLIGAFSITGLTFLIMLYGLSRVFTYGFQV